MSKISDAQDILSVLGLPPAQQNEISALTLLALCGLKEEDNWADATRKSLKISKDIMAFVNGFVQYFVQIFVRKSKCFYIKTFKKEVFL